ncbi:MAG: four-carbon acid sugar kinase family protein [Actinomycetota bacterium]|nr:four-carbon acid sugar kinase family protein [Actinomycetota bacterium]
MTQGPHPTAGPVLVVADDLTGANATAAGLARAGLRAVTVAAGAQPEMIAEFVSRFDAIVVSADNRHEAPGAAAEHVRRAVRAGWPASLVANRIDSTLRGNVGATTEALLTELGELTGGRRVAALCIPAHPEAQRQTVGGVQLLDGRRLEETELARDARSPIEHSEVAALLHQQTELPVRVIPLETVTGPAGQLGTALRAAVDDGTAVVVADALTVDHIERVVAAAVGLDDVVWLMVDPGPATVAMARHVIGGRRPQGAPYLAVSGSATELTRLQLGRLISERDVVVIRLDTDAAGAPEVDRTAVRLTDAIAQATAGQVVLLASALDESDLVVTDAAVEIPAALARVTRRALEPSRVDGLFLTGGDVAAACFAELAADGLDVTDEVVPLAVGGTFVGGPWSGLPVVTKGGLVGDGDTTIRCLEFLETAAAAARRHVAPARSRVR